MDTEKYTVSSQLPPNYSTAASPTAEIPSGLMPIETHPNFQPHPEIALQTANPATGNTYPLPDTQPVYPIKIENSPSYMKDGPIIGPGITTTKNWAVSRRCIILLILIVVVAVIVAIVVPVAVVVSRQQSTGISSFAGGQSTSSNSQGGPYTVTSTDTIISTESITNFDGVINCNV